MDNGHEPATKADLKAMEQRLEQKIEMVRSEMPTPTMIFANCFDDGQTELLKAFFSFAEAN